MTPVEFRGDLWHQKTRVPGLSCGVYVILRLAVLVEHRLVTDRQTDRHRAMASTAIAYHRAVKINVKIQIVISYVFACNKNKALQLQRVPILSILGYNTGSLAASGSTLLVLHQFCVGTGLYRILVRSFLR